MKTAIFLHDSSQIEAYERYIASVPRTERDAYEVVALGVPIEYALLAKGIIYASGRDLRSIPHAELSERAAIFARGVMNREDAAFFNYRDVPLTEVYRPILQIYLQKLLYFIDVFASLVEPGTYERILVFPSTVPVAETAVPLEFLDVRVAEDAARAVAEAYKIAIVVPRRQALVPLSRRLRGRLAARMFMLRRSAFGWGLFILNTVVGARPRARIRIVASDHWRNLAPLMRELPESELFLLDRMEALKVGLRGMWKYGIRFVHAENFLTSPQRRDAARRADEFVKAWRRKRDGNVPLQAASLRNVPVSLLVDTALEELFSKGGEKAIETVDAVHALYDRTKPDVVLVRAGISGQIHFPIMCFVARSRGIPSIELQHGILHIGRGSLMTHPVAEYVATYGKEVSNRLRSIGYSEEALLDVGSPRFDVYSSLRAHQKQTTDGPFTLACVVPAILPFSWSDTYEIVQFFENLADIARSMPQILPVFKLRPDTLDTRFYYEALAKVFGETPYRIEQIKPFPNFVTESDALLAIYSTTALEGLISGRPVIYNATLEMHAELGKEFTPYAEAGALLFVRTKAEILAALHTLEDPARRTEVVRRADVCMKENYAFDAHASKRLADAIRGLKNKQAI